MAHDHTYVSGEVLTAANLNDLTSGRVSYVSTTTSQTGITTAAVDLTSITTTFTAIASRYYKVTAYAPYWTVTAGTPLYVSLYITDGSNTILQQQMSIANANFASTSHASYIVSPGAGSVTYKARAITNTGTVTATAGSNTIIFILVEDLGSS